MSEAAVIPPGAGEVVGDSPDRRVEILCDHDPLHATWSRFGPGREGADLHVHHRHTDFFYVLDGELTVRLGLEDELVTVPAGTLARVPPDVVHGFRNAGGAEVRYLNLHAPGQGFADYMRAIRDGRSLTYDQHEPPADGGRPTGEASTRRADATGLLADGDELAVFERRHGDGERDADGRQLRALYVLEGELELALDDRTHRAPAGTWVTIPPGVPYSTSGPTRFLELQAPDSA
jgi:mannose-6-phosphate isomerase-like protein (cupin superfamily)